MDPPDLRRCDISELTARLTELHRASEPDELVPVFLPSRAELDRRVLLDTCVGAGFLVERPSDVGPSRLHRQWTLPDTVGPRMHMLVCGLNPSPAAANAGVGFFRPGNRFWPAAQAAGLVTCDRDPDHALQHDGVGMTDIVKRTTRKAQELSDDEYAAGMDRLARLVARWHPGSICFVGLAGWRTVRDRNAAAGWQMELWAGSPVYLMPSTSGLNASSQLPDFIDHLRAAAKPPPSETLR